MQAKQHTWRAHQPACAGTGSRGASMAAMPVLLFVLGTRPEAIKLAPLILAARAHGGFVVRVCVTGQHRDMLDSALEVFAICPDVDLDVMTPGQTIAAVTCGVLCALAPVLAAFRPHWVVVQGDSTSSFAAALAACHAGVRLAHVDAGVRSGATEPFHPEAVHQKLISAMAHLHCVSGEPARTNLLREGVAPEHIVLAGNTGLDAFYLMLQRLRVDPACRAKVRATLVQEGLPLR
jgi:UDP-N-acetylglucosamine 2-epimerase (non-hydrolysing)